MNIDLITLIWVVASTFLIYLMFKAPIKKPKPKELFKSNRQKHFFLILLSFVLTCSMLGMIEVGDMILRLTGLM